MSLLKYFSTEPQADPSHAGLLSRAPAHNPMPSESDPDLNKVTTESQSLAALTTSSDTVESEYQGTNEWLLVISTKCFGF